MFLLVPAHPGNPGQTAVKWLLLCVLRLRGKFLIKSSLTILANLKRVAAPACEEQRKQNVRWISAALERLQSTQEITRM